MELSEICMISVYLGPAAQRCLANTEEIYSINLQPRCSLGGRDFREGPIGNRPAG